MIRFFNIKHSFLKTFTVYNKYLRKLVSRGNFKLYFNSIFLKKIHYKCSRQITKL